MSTNHANAPHHSHTRRNWVSQERAGALVTAQRLKGGEIRKLHELYGGVGSGRLVITGAPGSGKSGAAVLLLLAALRHREIADDADRSKIPVPVMFTLHGWDPVAKPIQDWLTERLGQTYPQLAGPAGATKAALLLATSKVAVILDGLDEVPEKLRPVALRGLSQQATFRLVILSRLDELVTAAAKDHLEGAAAVELQDIDAETAAEWLGRIQLDPPPPGWGELTQRLREATGDPLAEALNTPLTLTLVRDTYREGDNVRELLDFCGSENLAVSRDVIVDHLLDRVLPAAYTQKPGHPRLVYDLQTAQHALCHIAAQMNQNKTRDLQWWLILEWIPRTLMALTLGITVGLVFGLGFGLGLGIVFGLVAGLVAGLLGRLRGEKYNYPERIGPGGWRDLIKGWEAVFALVFGFGVGVLAYITGRPVLGLVFGVVVGVGSLLTFSISRSAIGAASALTPLTAWRSDRTAGLASGLAAGLTGVVGGFLSTLAARRTGGLTFGLMSGLTVWLLVGVVAPQWSRTVTAFVHLSARWHVPVRMMRLLEDAHQRNVLRTIGPVYQFRHARLQDRLAEQVLTTCQNHNTS